MQIYVISRANYLYNGIVAGKFHIIYINLCLFTKN